MGHVLTFELANRRAVAELAHVERRLVRDVDHEPYAARAEDAAIRDVHDVAAEVLDGIEALGLAIPTLTASFLERVILQLALTRLIADRTIERVVDEQHLEHAFTRFECLVGVHVYHLPL